MNTCFCSLPSINPNACKNCPNNTYKSEDYTKLTTYELKDYTSFCQHSWVVSDSVLCSNPPQYKRICKICGKIETFRYGEIEEKETYEDIYKKFHSNLIEV